MLAPPAATRRPGRGVRSLAATRRPLLDAPRRFADGQLAERGGGLIDQSHTAIRQLLQEFNLPLVNVLAAEANGTDAKLRFLGSDNPLAGAARDLRDLWKRLHRDYVDAGDPTTYYQSTPRGRQLDSISIAQWIQLIVPD